MSGSFKVTLVWIREHHEIPINEEADKLAKEGINGIPSDPTIDIHFVLTKEIIRSRLSRQYLNRWKNYNGCRQSKTRTSELLLGRTKELQAMSRQKPTVAV